MGTSAYGGASQAIHTSESTAALIRPVVSRLHSVVKCQRHRLFQILFGAAVTYMSYR